MSIKELRVSLEKMLLESDKVMIFSHKEADLDAIASSLGMSLIAEKFQKPNHIFLSYGTTGMDDGAKLMLHQAQNAHSFIDLSRYNRDSHDGDLNVLCDVNSTARLQEEVLPLPEERTAIIDHHETGDSTVKAALSFINPGASSASEIMTKLLSYFEIKYSPTMANMLLSGILLDTDHFRGGKSGASTAKAQEELYRAGADNAATNMYFRENYESSRKLNSLIDRADFTYYNIVIMVGDENQIYTSDELAKAANYAISNYDVDAAYTIGYVDDGVINIKARSGGSVDVPAVMREFGGDGRDRAAAAELKGITLEEAAKRLREVIMPKHYVIVPKIIPTL